MTNGAAQRFPIEPTPERSAPTWPATLAIAAAAIVMQAAALRSMGRIWWCACGRPTPFGNSGNHNSQHLFDWYTPSHLLHGVILFWLLRACLPSARDATRLIVVLLIEIGWEILENTPFIIDRYRAATTSVSYYGDSIANSVSDVLVCVAGVVLARRIGLVGSIVVFFVAELTTLCVIRDNLTLNVVMLITPIDVIRHWQSGR